MSNTFAIANVTAALRNRLFNALQKHTDLAGTAVSTLPPDRANVDDEASRLNLFLYHVVPAASWRNQTSPQQVKPGETGYPPLGLTLHYVVSAFGPEGDDVLAHRMLAVGMAALHEQPLLSPAELKTAEPKSDLDLQVERVRITAQPLTTEEMYKLWSAFQTSYRVSAAYEVSVVLLDSEKPIKAPLPVLSIGSGGGVQPDLLPPYPTLAKIAPATPRGYALLGDTLTLTGHHLADDPASTVLVRFSHRLWTTPIDLSVDAVSATEATVTLPDAPAAWPAGLYTVSVVVTHPSNPTRITNGLPLALAPRILSVPSSPVSRDSEEIALLPLTVSPDIRPGQSVLLLLGTQGIAPPAITAQTDSITFAATSPGTFYLRLRIDGVDSPIVLGGPPPSFDPSLEVTIL
ncbi:DUF4255 domain-containing protein [Polyangium mundeleinium]|uniref:DUF4255 domain-containing protein n=1 Tax=Polyangium mundeleinium TaxID=2995306 RepID=A0ABT5ESQ1_9BACT|nr:DUF4255 domain-containing protein [Polyangium mundeleinium]MDC0744841.1 DUF4255 domain-containing protein [Polyangium mundeleinium]